MGRTGKASSQNQKKVVFLSNALLHLLYNFSLLLQNKKKIQFNLIEGDIWFVDVEV